MLTFCCCKELFFQCPFQVAVDSGSPLICQTSPPSSSGRSNGGGSDPPPAFHLRGLVTFGTSCAQEERPTVFTSVEKHVGWIQDKMRNQRKEQGIVER